MELPVRRGGDPDDREFASLRRSFAEQLDDWPDFRPSPERYDAVSPLADLEETDDAYLLDVELPGVDRADVELQVHADRLVLVAERRERRRVGLLRHRTRTTGRLALTVALPGPVDTARVTAELDRGVLSVVVPKAEPHRRRRIQVHQR